MKSTRRWTGSQCNWRNTGEMWSPRLVPVRSRAARQYTACECKYVCVYISTCVTCLSVCLSVYQSYAMSRGCRGKLLLICNDEFHSRSTDLAQQPALSERQGADADVHNISMLFKRLHFDVVYHNNLTARVNTPHVPVVVITHYCHNE